jgi:hypothetical protein
MKSLYHLLVTEIDRASNINADIYFALEPLQTHVAGGGLGSHGPYGMEIREDIERKLEELYIRA